MCSFTKQRYIQLIKSDSKGIIFQKNSVSNKCIFLLTFYQYGILNMYHGLHKYIKQHNCFQYDTKKYFLNTKSVY